MFAFDNNDFNAFPIFGTVYYISIPFAIIGFVQSIKAVKRDIKESKINAIDKLNKIQHYEFSWKSNNNYVDNGYIAQELEKIDPNYVYKDKISNQKYRYQVNTLKILSDVTKAIQEQQEEIELLKNKIAELEAKING